MKKILSSLILMLFLTGCNVNEQTQTESINNYPISAGIEKKYNEITESIVCREGKKIWVAVYDGYKTGGMTSQIIGEC